LQFFVLFLNLAPDMGSIGSIGNRIREVRNRLNLSQEEFAAGLEVSRSVLSQIEIDKIRPSVELITRIAKDYNIDYRWLMEGDRDSYFQEPDYPSAYDPRINRLENRLYGENNRISENAEYSIRLNEVTGESVERNEISAERILGKGTNFTREDVLRDREMPLISGYDMEEYPRQRESRGFLNKLSWLRLPTDPNRVYRAFTIPDMRLTPFLEKGDILVGYLIEDRELLTPMSYYIFVTEKRVLFGMIQEITAGKELSITENPLMQKPQIYNMDEIREYWMVDKLITDNFVSRFRYMQMMMQNMGLGSFPGLTGNEK